jgi:hypothetical protein
MPLFPVLGWRDEKIPLTGRRSGMNALSMARRLSFSTMCILGVMAGLAPAALAQETELQKLEVPVVAGLYTVLMTDAEGVESEVFSHRNRPVFDINFTLAMSSTDKYPVTITLVQGEEERQIYKGTLEEGYYRLLYPLIDLPVSGGEVAVKVILKTRIFVGKKYSGRSDYDYKTWKGIYRVGKR